MDKAFYKNIIKHLKNKNISLTVLEECDSTNTYAKSLAESGAPDLSVVIAKRQSAGRGRMGRSFFSPDKVGMYMSIILKKDIQAAHALEITCAAAVAISRTIEAFTKKDVRIKWVNDIYIDMKKVCGILTEASINVKTGKLNYAVLGVGANLFAPEKGFPDDIGDIASSIFDFDYDEETKASFISAFTDEFISVYPDIGQNMLVDEYRSRSIMPEREIFVLRGDERIHAKALDIEDDYSLLVEYDDGKREALRSGDVSIKIKTD